MAKVEHMGEHPLQTQKYDCSEADFTQLCMKWILEHGQSVVMMPYDKMLPVTYHNGPDPIVAEINILCKYGFLAWRYDPSRDIMHFRVKPQGLENLRAGN